MKLLQAKKGYLTFLKASGYSPSTVALYDYVLNTLATFLEDMEVERIKASDLTKYFAYLRDGYKPNRKNGSSEPLSGSTLQNHWKAIRTFFGWAKEDLRLKARPDLTLKLPSRNPKVIMPFSEKEVKVLLKVAEYSEAAPGNRKAYTMRKRTADRDIALILTLIDTGLRVGELCRLNVGDVNLETGEVYVAPYGNSNRKTKSRVVYLGKGAKRAVWRYLAKRIDYDETDSLFITERRRKRITTNSVRLLIANLGKKAGLAECHPHKFRHTFCIEFLRNDGDLFNLQTLTGHSTLDMLKTYLQIAKGDTAKAHKRASPVDKWGL